MLNLTPTEISNLALDELPYDTITSWSENTQQAKAARRQYPASLSYVLELAEWGFARQRVALSVLTNDRGGEWQFSYSLPNNVAMLIRVLAPLDEGGGYVPMVGQLPVLGPIAMDAVGADYDLSGGKLYTGIEGAVLEYIATDGPLSPASAMFRDTLVYELAARLAMPLTQDPSKRDALKQRAEFARDRAVALNNNQRPQRYGNFIPDDVLAREGDPLAFWRG